MQIDSIQSRSIRITKSLEAPIEKVWEVWANAEHIAAWWGPRGFTNTIHSMNFTEGGEWLLTMHGPDGKNYPNKSIFREIIPLKKIVYEHFNPNYIATIIFDPIEDKTYLDWTATFETEEMFDIIVKTFKADEGLEQNVEKLEKYLANRQQ